MEARPLTDAQEEMRARLQGPVAPGEFTIEVSFRLRGEETMVEAALSQGTVGDFYSNAEDALKEDLTRSLLGEYSAAGIRIEELTVTVARAAGGTT